MGQAANHSRVLLVTAAFSRYPQALDWAHETTARHWGPIVLASERFEFSQTEYYTPSMGSGLLKQFWAFERTADPAMLPDWKRQANGWEEEYARQAGQVESRPLNLDPGYITPGKLVLASTKDFAHRIYLRDGIFAEITLFYRHHRWQPHEFTFPDYRRADYQAFFSACREHAKRIASDGV